MRIFLLCVALSLAICDYPLNPMYEFVAWKEKHNKVYESQEEEHLRYKNFARSFEFVKQHNANPNMKWQAGLNAFSDHSTEEFKNSYFGNPQECSATNSHDFANLLTWSPKESMDWREQKIVSPVKNQGHCGSCWTFSTTGCLEAHWAIANGLQYGEDFSTPLLAEQQLVDCAGAFKNNGCDGGLPSQAFEYIHYTGGILKEAQYEYTAKDGTCSLANRGDFAVSIVGHSVNITDESFIQLAVSELGPVSIAFDCMNDFLHYKSGVYHNDACGNQPYEVNHAVLVVGYGTDDVTGLDYWLVKNSWGEEWGEQGYFKIERGVNMCGVADCASFPDVTGKFTESPAIQMEPSLHEPQVYL